MTLAGCSYRRAIEHATTEECHRTAAGQAAAACSEPEAARRLGGSRKQEGENREGVRFKTGLTDFTLCGSGRPVHLTQEKAILHAEVELQQSFQSELAELQPVQITGLILQLAA